MESAGRPVGAARRSAPRPARRRGAGSAGRLAQGSRTSLPSAWPPGPRRGPWRRPRARRSARPGRRAQPSAASSASWARAASRTSVPGSAPGPPPRARMPSSPARRNPAIVAMRCRSATTADRRVERLVGTDGVDRDGDRSRRADRVAQAVEQARRRTPPGSRRAPAGRRAGSGTPWRSPGRRAGRPAGRPCGRRRRTRRARGRRRRSCVPVADRVCTAVAPASRSPDAAAQSRLAGRRTVTCSETTIRSAYPPSTRHAMTSSPGDEPPHGRPDGAHDARRPRSPSRMGSRPGSALRPPEYRFQSIGVDGRGPDVDHDVARSGLRGVDVDDAENLGAAVGDRDDGSAAECHGHRLHPLRGRWPGWRL